MNRLFLALNIPYFIKEKIFLLRDSVIPNSADYKWERIEKLHITLKFIGEVEDNLVLKIKNELSFISNYNAFACSLNKFGFFYTKREPKILLVSFKIDEKIFNFVDRLDKELIKFGIKPEERKFKPHLTLMRVKKKLDQNFINSFENCKLPDTEFIADSVSLIKSELHSDSSRYSEIKNYSLMGGSK